jgi:hypothetical protein
MGQYEAGISKQKQALGMYQDMAGTERDQADGLKSIGVALHGEFRRHSVARGPLDKRIGSHHLSVPAIPF